MEESTISVSPCSCSSMAGSSLTGLASRSPAIGTPESRTSGTDPLTEIPCRRIQRFAVGINGRLHVLGEVGIGHRRVAELLFIRLHQRDALTDFPAWSLRRLDDGHRTMVLLHDHLDAFLDLGQYGVNIAGEFGFGNADRGHVFDRSVSSSWALSLRGCVHCRDG